MCFLNLRAQCPYNIITTNGPVYSMHNVEGDGLYIGGKFDSINNVLCYGICKYSNGVFEMLGDGLGPDADVRSIISHNNLIIACGSQLYVDGVHSCIAIWNGQTWYHPNINFTPSSILLGEAINDDILFFGGVFNLIGSTSSSHLLKYDYLADTFAIIPTNLNSNGSVIRHLVFLNDTLFVSGTLTDAITQLTISIMYYTNSVWHSIYLGGTEGHINNYTDLLTITGMFSPQTGDVGNNIQYLKNGVWYAMNQGLNDAAGYSLKHDSKLFVTGIFDKADGKTARSIAAWDGSNWCSVNEPITEFLQFGIGTISFYQDTLFMTGAFNCGIGSTWWNLAKWKYPYFLNNCEPNSVTNQYIGNNNLEIIVYPNPASQSLKLTLLYPYANEQVQLIDVLGREIYTTIRVISQSELELNISQVPSGVYLISTTSGGKVYRNKVVVSN